MESERILPKEKRHCIDEANFLIQGDANQQYIGKLVLALESTEEENRKLREEIDRLKGLVEKAFDKASQYSDPLFYSWNYIWEQFKEENNL